MKAPEGRIFVNYGNGYTLTDAGEPDRMPDPHATYSYEADEEEVFASVIRSCEAWLTRGTAYEGGQEWEHGAEEGSPDCTCGQSRHVVTDDGYIIPSIMHYADRHDYDQR